MARGRLRCLGSSLRLKSRFGSGYNVSVGVRGKAEGEGATIIAEDEASGFNKGDPVTLRRLAEIKEVFLHRLGVKPGKQFISN